MSLPTFWAQPPMVERDASGLLLNGVTNSGTMLYRTGSLVTIALGITIPSGSVSGTAVMDIPLGFRRATTFHGYMPKGYAGAPDAYVSATQVLIYGSGAGTWRYAWTWPTRDPWPA